MREWLTVIIVLLIIGILLDGFRRMRAHRRETLRLSKNMLETDPLLDNDDKVSGSEFPSGGARVAGYREATDVENVHQNLKENYAASKVTRGAPKRQVEPEQVALNLDTPVPMLMESVTDNEDEQYDAEVTERNYEEEPDFDHSYGRTSEPTIGNLDDLDDEDASENYAHEASVGEEQMDFVDLEQAQLEEINQVQHREEPDDFDGDLSPPRVVARKSPAPSSVENFADKQTTAANPITKPEQPATSQKPAAKVASAQPTSAQSTSTRPEPKMPDEVLVINVMAKRGEVFLGEPLLQALLDNGLRFGDMDIFHRHESTDGRGKVLFSLANMVKPGTFDLDEMETFETPGVSMFLTLPIASDSIEAFNLMADTAQALVQSLGGELKDENRSVMTRQTIEHSRQRVVEYERKRRLAKA